MVNPKKAQGEGRWTMEDGRKENKLGPHHEFIAGPFCRLSS
jgi:hypothetical protein